MRSIANSKRFIKRASVDRVMEIETEIKGALEMITQKSLVIKAQMQGLVSSLDKDMERAREAWIERIENGEDLHMDELTEPEVNEAGYILDVNREWAVELSEICNDTFAKVDDLLDDLEALSRWKNSKLVKIT